MRLGKIDSIFDSVLQCLAFKKDRPPKAGRIWQSYSYLAVAQFRCAREEPCDFHHCALAYRCYTYACAINLQFLNFRGYRKLMRLYTLTVSIPISVMVKSMSRARAAELSVRSVPSSKRTLESASG